MSLNRATRFGPETHQFLSFCRSLFRDLAPSLLVKGATKLPKQEEQAVMKVEQAKQIVSKAIEELGQALERGHSESLRNYLAAIGRFRSVQSTERNAYRIAGTQLLRTSLASTRGTNSGAS